MLKPNVRTDNQSLVCRKCGHQIPRPELLKNIFPFLDSLGSGRAIVQCGRCRDKLQFMHTHSPKGGHHFHHVEIVGVPGPDYEMLQENALVTEPGEAVGWFLEGTVTAWETFTRRGYDVYACNWIMSGLPALILDLPNSLEKFHEGPNADARRMAMFDLELWDRTGYLEILEDLEGAPCTEKAKWGIRAAELETPEGKRIYNELTNDLVERAYSAYHGRTLNLEWLKTELRPLVNRLQVISEFWRKPQSENPVAPPHFGDFVKDEQGQIFVVAIPVNNAGSTTWVEFPEFPRADRSTRHLLSGKQNLSILVGRFADLPGEIKAKLRFDAEAVLLGHSLFENGVHLIEPNQRENFENRQWHKLTAGTQKNAETFFGSLSPKIEGYRILIHFGNDWSTWKCLGPMPESEVEPNLAAAKKRWPLQARLGEGRYEARGDRINKIEIYRGLALIREVNHVVGQGDAFYNPQG